MTVKPSLQILVIILISFILSLPFIGWATVRFVESGYQIGYSLRPLLWAAMGNQGGCLRSMRTSLVMDVEEALLLMEEQEPRDSDI